MRTYLLAVSTTSHNCYDINSNEVDMVYKTYHSLEKAKKDLKELAKRYLRPIKHERYEVTIDKVFEDDCVVMIVKTVCSTIYQSVVCELTTIKIIEV